jgi:hypothetical protein
LETILLQYFNSALDPFFVVLYGEYFCFWKFRGGNLVYLWWVWRVSLTLRSAFVSYRILLKYRTEGSAGKPYIHLQFKFRREEKATKRASEHTHNLRFFVFIAVQNRKNLTLYGLAMV